MPIYEYKCLKCNEIFSLLQTLSPTDNNTECPKCYSKEVKKIFSSFCCGTGSESKAASLPTPNFGRGGG